MTMDIFQISYIIVSSNLLLNFVTGIKHIYVQEGSTFIIVCEVRSPLMTWTGPPEGCILSENNFINPDCKNHARLNMTGSNIHEYNLQIENVQDADIGSYSCYGNSVNGTYNAQMFYLHLKVPLQMLSFYPDGEVNIRQNDTEKFVCSARSVPYPVVTWFLDGIAISATSQNLVNDTVTSMLDYLGKVKDNGNYLYCGAQSNGSLKNSSLAILNITYGPMDSVLFNKSPPSAVKLEGENLDAIACSANCNPMCQYQWTKEGNIIENKGTFSLQNLTKEDHGIYTCTAWNTFGNNTKDFDLRVNYGPKLVVLLPNQTYYSRKENETIQVINCTSSCRPPCTMIWIGANGQVGTSQELTFQKINRIDAGHYKCNASNAVSSMFSIAVNITVTYGPGYSISLNITTKSLTKETGDQLNPIVCSAKCIPNCQYEWITPDNTVQHGDTMFIPSLKKHDHGYYRCRASNEFGNKTIGFNLTVNYGPEKVNLSQHNTSYVVEEYHNVETIHCMSSCRPMCEVIWIGPKGQLIETSPALNLLSITREEAGVYRCNASNIVGSMVSSNITVIVTFAAVINFLTVNDTNNCTVMENANVILNCSIDGIPQPMISWRKDGKEIKENENKTSYAFPTAACTNTGNYTCEALNNLGRSNKTKELFVICKSRYDFRRPILSNKIGVKDDEGLNITIYLIGYPEPTIHWTFHNLSMDKLVQNSFNTFDQVSILYKQKMTNKDFGIYSMTAFNNVGEMYSRDFIVESQRRPDLPGNVSVVVCEKTSITVEWKSNFDGGDTQVFRVLLQNWKTNNTIYSKNMSDPGEDAYRNATTHSLIPSTLYLVFVQAINNHGVVTSEEHINCSTDADPIVSSSTSSTAKIGGIAGSVCALVVICVITIMYWVHRKRTKDTDKELIESTKKTDENGDDELKDNPLYVTSDDTCKSIKTAVYSTVKKNQPAVYSTIQKTSKPGHKGKHVKGAKSSGKKSVTKIKEIELGSVYENSDKILKRGTNDDIYANADQKEQRCQQSEESNNPIKNKDGLIYADLDLLPSPGGKKFVIRGIENRNNYAIIDLSKTAEPLPSDDDEEEDNTNSKNKKGDVVE